MKEEDFDWIDDQSRAFLQEPHEKSGFLLKIIAAIVLAFFVWAYFAKLDERTSAEGQVIPSTQIKEIQNLEGGILKEIYVKEGDIVKEGQLLLLLDDTRFASQYREILVKYYALFADFKRLDGEVKGAETLEFSQKMETDYPEFVTNARRHFNANRTKHLETLKSLRTNASILDEQLKITEPLAEEGVVSKIELLKIQREANEARGKIDLEINQYLSNANEQLVKVKSEMDSLKNSLDGLKDRMLRTSIYSPVHGIVKKININTLGGVIQPGEEILQIVPLDDILWVEARVRPEKIAFIRPGQEASVKITAYDSSIYGSLKGHVKHISADVIKEKDALNRDETFYKIIVETDSNHLEFAGEELPIIPGMQASADILTGEKTVLEYILKPIIKAKDKALRER